MLTRLEADGFKNLVEFSVEFGPCTCIAGPNGIGKSNIFDAIHFLSLLTDRSILEAALHVRARTGDTARIDDLFFRSGDSHRDVFKLAAEMLVDQEIRDDFARTGKATSTFLRYEIEIGRRTDRADRTDPFISDMELRSESLSLIRQGDAGKRLRFPHSKAKFRDAVVKNRRFAKSGYISTEWSQDGEPEIVIHQDGGARGPGQRAAARTAPKTIVGTTNSIATPTILAARREMQKWRLLSLEPSAMRQPDRLRRDPPFVSDNGRHLASALDRLVRMRSTRDDDVAARISARLAELVPITGVDVMRDDVRELLTLSITEASGQQFPASAVSDGTLRFLALAVLAEDPEARGLLCIEEPENGVHPERLRAMATLVRDLAVDGEGPLGDGNVMRQVVVATHSPYFLQLQDRNDVLIAKEVSLSDVQSASRVLRCYPLVKTWRSSADERRALGPSMMRDPLVSSCYARVRRIKRSSLTCESCCRTAV